MKNAPSKKHEDRKVKGSMVTSKTGDTFFRKEHLRNMEINVNQNQLMVSLLNNKLTTATIESANTIQQGGLTENVLALNMKSQTGAPLKAQFKGINDDAFISPRRKETVDTMKQIDNSEDFLKQFKQLVRPSIHLNTRENESPLSYDQHIESETLPDRGRDKYKGHLFDRELASSALAKALGFTHVPDISVKRVSSGDTKNKLGIIVNDIPSSFRDNNTVDICRECDNKTRKAAAQASDPKLGDKAIFDYLIGNLDRNVNNYFYKTKNDGSVDFIGFDHGLSFPSNNDDVKNYYNEENAGGGAHPGINSKVSKEFITNLVEFAKGGTLTDIGSYISENIGQREHDAFMGRVKTTIESIFKEKKYTLKDIVRE